MRDRLRQILHREVNHARNVIEMKTTSFLDHLFFKENKADAHEKKKINFFVTVWGEHIDFFYSCIVPSLLQPGNVPMLAKDGYLMELVVYTLSEEDVDHLNAYTDKLNELKEYMTVTFRIIQVKEIRDKNDILIKALLQHLEKCYAEHAWFLVTPPDIIIGNHSLVNAMRLVEGQDTCLAVPYPRIQKDLVFKEEKFQRFAEGRTCLENDELVDFAFQQGKSSLSNYFDHDQHNSTREGLSLRSLDDRSHAVVINTPSPFILSVKQEDINFFKFCPNYNHIDKLWMRKLVRNNRMKVVGSSDVAFFIELTGLEKPKILVEDSLYNDKYGHPGKRLANHFIFNSCYCLWRGRMKEKRTIHFSNENRSGETLNV